MIRISSSGAAMNSADETIIIPAGSPQNVTSDGFMDDDEWDEALAQINMNLRGDAAPQPASTSGHLYTYKNVPIQFPYRAYKSQHQMMEKIIEGVTTGENCLLESPTGTGKTAALLCSLLGWQRDCYQRGDNCAGVIEAAAEKLGGCSCGLIKDKERTKILLKKSKKQLILVATTTYPDEEAESEKVTPPVSKSNSKTSSPAKVLTPTKSSSPNKTPTKPIPTSSSSCPGTPGTPAKVKYCNSPIATEHAASPYKRSRRQSEETEERYLASACAYCIRKGVIDRSRPPRIYYCTRTHSQIAQVVKQLKATSYNNAKMTILAGREPTCINEKALKVVNPADLSLVIESQSAGADQNKDPKINISDYCGTLKKNYNRIQKMKKANPVQYEQLKLENQLPEICKYFAEKSELSHHFSTLQRQGAWDLEDIKLEGLECEKCPFYGCQALQDSADIVFGSYNYLLMPEIRDNKDVKYINSVLVFDEAHNIEDICRSAYSFDIEVENFDRNIRELVDSLLLKGHEPRSNVKQTTLKSLTDLSVTFKKWSDKIKEWGNKEVERRGRDKDKVKVYDISKPYESKELMEALVDMDMIADSVKRCLNCTGEADQVETEKPASFGTEEEEYYLDVRGNKHPFVLSSKVGEFLKTIKRTLQYLCGEEIKGIGGSKDFKGYLTGVANPSRKSAINQSDDSRRARFQTRQQQNNGPEFFFKFEIICLNPALGFRDLRNTAYSIIVTSGTLTPLNSFACELGTNFEVTLQADHVIPTSNVWAGVISNGPSNQDLLLNKAHQDDTSIQDDLGKIICDICYTVPNGVLVFFPSYTLMRTLEDRWRNFPRGNPIFNKITQRKAYFIEDSKDKKAFKLNMERYKEFVKGGPTWDGCVLFAVFRGKISEGIDFADEQARAVVTIGIPFSNAGAAPIVSKKSYNNMRKKAAALTGEQFLSGSEWYTTQAFRAMNQGFGRCVRHCNDWGALILIDSRLTQRHNQKFLSGWVRKNVKPYKNFSEVKSTLADFIKNMKIKMKAPRQHIEIEYEDDNLDCTELVEYPNDDSDMNSQDDQMLTQVAALHDSALHNMTTQRVPIMSSTPLPQRERDDEQYVVESSPEYSFTQEVDEVLGSQLSPDSSTATQALNHHQNEDSDSSVSVYGRTPPDSDMGNDSDDDREMMFIAERLQSSVDDQQSQSQSDIQLDESDILDVSMPSANSSRNSMSQISNVSNVSYNSE